MTEVSSTTGAPASAVSRLGAVSRGAAASSLSSTNPTTRADDNVQLSQMAQLLSKLREMPDVRQELIDQTRQEIRLGRYDTPERLDSALDHMIDEFTSGF